MESIKDKELKNGYTTGSAATAASKAALIMLITGKAVDEVSIITPSLNEYKPKVYGQEISNNKSYASCYVIKESGDDPDITAGIKIYSKVSYSDIPGVTITGGAGIGKVTRPGLDQAVGEYAINSVPRQMIKDTLSMVLDSFDIESGVTVEISAPEGAEIAKKTFNPHMGIEGGISIIGTSGIVKPMSTEALIDTIKLDIKMQYSEGKDTCVIVPGNYGVTFLENNYGISEKDIVLCSNFVGDSIKFAADEGFKKILFCSHIGKMIKVSGGVLNTHSKYGDRRMEFMCNAYKEAFENSDTEIEKRILECVSTTAALDVLSEINAVNDVAKVIVKNSLYYLNMACDNKAEIGCILYENNYGELYKSI